jgi:serine protease Do
VKIKNIIVSLALVIALMSGTSCLVLPETEVQSSAAPTISTNSPYAAAIEDTKTIVEYPDFISVIAAVKPSVVAITTEVPVDFFGRRFTQEGAGSGWIIDESGFIVTNKHVVEGARNVTVTLEDGRTFPAVSVHTDQMADLAVIKINAQDLPALQTGNSSEMKVGEWVVAIGNSLGLGISATKGIVSALGVSLSTSPRETLDELIQTDAAINPGNSGGPLINLRGQVVGINTAKVAQVGVEGMGYAISISEAEPVVEKLISES